MTWLMLYYDALEDYALLTDDQFGRLIRAALHFAKTGEEKELNAPESYIWPVLRNRLIRDKERYEEKCRKNAENINKRWEQQREPGNSKPPGGYERIRTDTNVYDSYEEKVKVESERENEIEYQIKSEATARVKLNAKGYTDSEIDRALSRIPGGEHIRNLTAYLKKAIDEERREKIIGKPVPAQNYTQRDYSGETDAAMDRMMLDTWGQEAGQ